MKREAGDAGKAAKKVDESLYGGVGQKVVAEGERFGNKIGNELKRVDDNLKNQAADLKKFYDPSALRDVFCK